MEITKYVFSKHGDERGDLVAIEEMKDIPFDIKRVYYMFNTDTSFTRGMHAHKNLQQILLCVHGSCTLVLDNGKEREEVLLNEPNVGVYIANNMWREMKNFTEDAVLLVLASTYYDEEDYIRDYDAFLKYVREEQ